MNKSIPFGKYYLLERINVGGMAEVFKAKTVGVEGFERIVALKRILPSIAEDEEFITMFIDEAKIAVQLQHANIAQIFDLGKVEDSYFIALEYVNGRDLRGIFDDVRKLNQVMPMAQVCYVVMQLCEGLDYAHNKRDAQGRELNLVHRDISPQNVLIGHDGEVKLIDFGIAKAAGKASKTQAGILKGKFGYMSPEQVRGLPIDRRSDIFALGIVLYEMLTGERLFIGESDFSTLEKVRNVEIVPPSSLNSAIPEKLERIVLKALEKNVEDRYQNAIDLHDDLQLFLHSVGQFSSRKDLSAWMKRTFPSAGQEESDSLDPDDVQEIQEVDALTESQEMATETGKLALKPGPENGQADGKSDRKNGGEEEFGWDEEEMETQIFDRDPAQLVMRAGGNVGLASPSDDKTVAGVPSQALLDEMGESFESSLPTAPAAKTPPPADPYASGRDGPRQTRMGGAKGSSPVPLPAPPASFPSLAQTTPGVSRARTGEVSVAQRAEGSAPMFQTPRAAPRQTLMGGMQAPSMPVPGLSSAPGSLGGPAYPTYQPGPGQPTAGLPVPSFPGAMFPGAPVPVQNPQYQTMAQGYAQPAAPRAPARAKYYVTFLLFMIAGGAGAYMYMTRPGKLQVAIKPQDAHLSVGGVIITNGPPYLLEKRPGVYRIAVARDGYVTREQSVQISAGQAGHMDIELEPAGDTGFDLTSQPSGGLVWLDGQPLTIDDQGHQATTNFHASRIATGRHVIEIRGNPRFQDWRQEFFQEPGRTVRLHADLLIAGTPSKPSASGKTLPPAPAAVSTTAPAEGPPTTLPSTKGIEARHGGGGRRPGGKTAFAGSDGVEFDARKPATPSAPAKASTASDDDIFETEGKPAKESASSTCTATISSKPWAEVSIDGKPTGKITPLVNYTLPCGKHRISFKNADLMIERNESITLKPGQVFKKIFSLVETEL